MGSRVIKNLPVSSITHPGRWMTVAERRFWREIEARPFLAKAFEYVSLKKWEFLRAALDARGAYSQQPVWSIDVAAGDVRYGWSLPEFYDMPEDAFRMGNDLRPFFARWVMNQHPHLDGFYQLRPQFSHMGDLIEDFDVGLAPLALPASRTYTPPAGANLLALPAPAGSAKPGQQQQQPTTVVNGRRVPVLPVDGKIRTRVR